MACASCGGGARNTLANPRPTVKAQPPYPNVRVNPATQPNGPVQQSGATNPNTALPSTNKRTQV
jgi:hypothetical protein